MKQFTALKIKIPTYVKSIARILINESHQAFLVGGSIRDLMIGRIPHDYEIATDAHPNVVLESFPRSVSTGIKFGTVTVLSRDENMENIPVEVTTFRSEEQYVDGRWPLKVQFEKSIEKDLSRRDFTINAFAVDLSQKGIEELDNFNDSEDSWEVIDLFDGVNDLKNRIIRAVGNPLDRFTEDGLRPFRACRLASVLQFAIEPRTFIAMRQALPVSRMVSMERIRDEFMKMLLGSPKPSIGIELMRLSGLLEIFIPELLETIGVVQPKFHTDDVYHHLLRSVDVAADSVKLASLFHDIGKPRKSMPDGHFYGHDIESEKITKEVMRRMKFSNQEIDRTAKLVRNHMFYYPYTEEELRSSMIKETENGSKDFKFWSDSAVRRFIRRVGEDLIEDLFLLRIADANSNQKTLFDPREIEALQLRISEVRKKDMALKVEDLKIDGNDLMKLGMKPSPKMGKLLNEILEMVVEDPNLNDKEKLLNIAKNKMSQQ